MLPGYEYFIQFEAFQCVKIDLQLGKSREVTSYNSYNTYCTTVESEPKIRKNYDFELEKKTQKIRTKKELISMPHPRWFFQKTSRLRLAEKTVPGLSYVFFLWQQKGVFPLATYLY